MIILGVSILGNLNKEATSEDSLGTAYWRIVISSGILACILGLVNIFASYMFRQKSLGVTARQVRMHGNLAEQKVYFPPTASGASSNYSPQLSAKPTVVGTPHSSTRGDSHRPRRSFWLNRRSASLPSYHPRPTSNHTPPHQHRHPIRNISAPIGSGAGPGSAPAMAMSQSSEAPQVVNYSLPGSSSAYPEKTPRQLEEEGYAPVVNGIQRPDLAHHPALQGGRF